MSSEQIAFLVFGIVLIPALLFDLGLFSKAGKKISIKAALRLTLFWVALAMSFFGFLWIWVDHTLALQYLGGYLMEWSLSIDNIFVFIVIFSAFSVKEKYYSRILLAGILMAILFRVIFIAIGVVLVEKFEWILYIFGGFLIITGYRIFFSTEHEEFNPKESKVYRLLSRIFPLTSGDGEGNLSVMIDGKKRFTTLFVVIIMLAFIDVLFALDSIPAVMGISTDRMVIYTSNIFAVLGLRSLFFLLRGAVSKFDYLQQGIAIVLVFIGVKMLAQHYVDRYLDKTQQVIFSLAVIISCISGAMVLSVYKNKKGVPPDYKEPE
jgi:tellurite resistance protein TerC